VSGGNRRWHGQQARNLRNIGIEPIINVLDGALKKPLTGRQRLLEGLNGVGIIAECLIWP